MQRRGSAGVDDRLHEVTLTGKSRPWKRRASLKKNDRIRETQLQYTCTCGFMGWSAHAELAKDGRTAEGKRVRLKPDPGRRVIKRSDLEA